MKRLSVLGSTGSIGTQTMDVIRSNKELFSLEAIAANSSVDLLEQQVREFRPKLAVVYDESKYIELKNRVGALTEVATGLEGLIAAATITEADTVVSSIVGIAGLIPTYHAITHKKNIALANKETLVAGGRLIMAKAKENNIAILPVDSEHSAIFQSIGCNKKSQVSKIILTASGGPFRTKTKEELLHVSLADALNHPNWKMGKKITVDSASLMNKGLEVIEAKWLFDVSAEEIEVCVHPQSIIHSMVEFVDGSVVAQLGLPDMKLPIQYALTYPDRLPMSGDRLNLAKLGNLSFEEPDINRFPSLKLAYDALNAGDSACIVMNGANEAAVELFLNSKISFIEIPRLIAAVLEKHEIRNNLCLEEIIEIDQWARNLTNVLFEKRCSSC
ncbi:MAG: 1-deoxy-D-xylulose-5-phosphate reductoisomerase [Clostridia bacterium]|jgi:1-deoxy-D-xylulose-5-phosphate reductoisomerase|nr:1-deoxy-D-xylulose-5-phosphate reductoisomerase [Clostridia bacterium]